MNLIISNVFQFIVHQSFYISSSNTPQMTYRGMIWNGQVWAILRMAEVLLIRDLRKLDLEAVPMMLRLVCIDPTHLNIC